MYIYELIFISVFYFEIMNLKYFIKILKHIITKINYVDWYSLSGGGPPRLAYE